MDEAARTLTLRPEHLSTLADAQPTGLLAARIYRSGSFSEDGFVQYGRLEFLANCGLVEFIAKAGRRSVEPGDVWMYYYLTEQGRVLLRWRAGVETVGPIERSARRRAARPIQQAVACPP